ncbi:MAG: hypothetical protein ACFFEW_06650 [Candidatus Thorarchaeota archaeon]
MMEVRNRLLTLLRSHIVLILILIASFIVWTVVFSLAAQDFLVSGTRPFRYSWDGIGQFELFGWTINYEFEGYVDYDFYYLTWADQFLNGVIPYTDAFNQANFDGIDYNTPFFLPPLFLYLCVIGASMGPLGLGFLISVFGFITAFPVYGISKYLSKKKRIAEISVATYLLNPLVLFQTTYKWMNPAPFVFFTTLAFYLFMKQRRFEGTLAITTAIFFKQIAIFFALPLIAYLIKKPPKDVQEDNQAIRDGKGNLLSDYVDLRSFAKVIAVIGVFAVLLSLPYILDFRNYLYYMLERPGAVLYDDLTSLPDFGTPITFTALLILLGAPEGLSALFNVGIYYTLFLLPGVIGTLGLCLFEEKDDRNLKGYWRKIFYLTLLLVFWLHIFSPRGIYKYYLVAIIPLISILSSSSMMRSETTEVNASVSMIVNPFLIGLLILFPSRHVYLTLLVLMMLMYLLHKQLAEVNGMIGARIRLLRVRLISKKDL